MEEVTTNDTNSTAYSPSAGQEFMKLRRLSVFKHY